MMTIEFRGEEIPNALRGTRRHSVVMSSGVIVEFDGISSRQFSDLRNVLVGSSARTKEDVDKILINHTPRQFHGAVSGDADQVAAYEVEPSEDSQIID